jgi:hypothetical protein
MCFCALKWLGGELLTLGIPRWEISSQGIPEPFIKINLWWSRQNCMLYIHFLTCFYLWIILLLFTIALGMNWLRYDTFRVVCIRHLWFVIFSFFMLYKIIMRCVTGQCCIMKVLVSGWSFCCWNSSVAVCSVHGEYFCESVCLNSGAFLGKLEVHCWWWAIHYHWGNAQPHAAQKLL